MNDSRTNGSICAEAVPPGSYRFKKAQLDPAGAIAKLIHMRSTIGANTRAGYTISTLAEQTENKRTYIRPAWAQDRRQTLDFQIEKSLARLGG